MKTFYFLFFIIPNAALAQITLSADTAKDIELEEVVITVSKKEESLQRSSVSIETLLLKELLVSPHHTFFDAIGNLKGIQMITPSLGFKVINARGFTNTTNVRFVQLVDGVDNQAPHIGAPIGNSLGPSDLDVLRVEVVPGSSSVIYGMNAINGIANFLTKDPFQFPGLTVQQKLGINHIHSKESNAKPYSESSIRYAGVFRNKFAIKLNGTFSTGTDWYANNYSDLTPLANQTTHLTGSVNPGKNLVNVYGDEPSNRRTISIQGKQYVISRTGYFEKDLTDYKIENLKGDLTLYYKPHSNYTLTYTYRLAFLNTIYQRTNRFYLEDYLNQQHVLALKAPSIQAKAYVTSENTGNSYNLRSLGENIDRSYKSDDRWYSDFSNKINNEILAGRGLVEAIKTARSYADIERPLPGKDGIDYHKNKLKAINNWDMGAALRVKAFLSHVEAQYLFSNDFFKEWNMDLFFGVDGRNYSIIPDGNYFINPKQLSKNLNYWKVGGYLQTSKSFLGNRIKVSLVVRVDKNEYFKTTLNPRIGVVYTPDINHNIRASFQTGARYPSIFEAFSNINSGGVKRVGGLPLMSNGIFENSYLRNSIDAFQAAVTRDVNNNSYSISDAVLKNKFLLRKNTYTYLQPESVKSLELGYRTGLFEKRLNIDFDFYYNIYQNLMTQVEANVPRSSVSDSIPFYLNDKRKQDKYRLWTNSKTATYNYGGTVGIIWKLYKSFILNANVTYSKLSHKVNSDGLEDGFNTPSWVLNLGISNHQIFKRLGISFNIKWQDKYLWQSSLASGIVPSYTTLDGMISYNLNSKTTIKIGGTNLLNHYYYSYMGGPSVGGFYYCTITFNI